jgi:hypothetical protein
MLVLQVLSFRALAQFKRNKCISVHNKHVFVRLCAVAIRCIGKDTSVAQVCHVYMCISQYCTLALVLASISIMVLYWLLTHVTNGLALATQVVLACTYSIWSSILLQAVCVIKLRKHDTKRFYSSKAGCCIYWSVHLLCYHQKCLSAFALLYTSTNAWCVSARLYTEAVQCDFSCWYPPRYTAACSDTRRFVKYDVSCWRHWHKYTTYM